MFLNIVYRKCLAVVFKSLLQNDLNEFVLYWNSHKIRESKHFNCIGGIPNDLYDMPGYYGMVYNYSLVINIILLLSLYVQAQLVTINQSIAIFGMLL